MRRKQDWIQLLVVMALLAMLVLEKISARDAMEVLRALPICDESYGGPIRVPTRNISITFCRSAAAVGNWDSSLVRPSLATSPAGIQRATATSARATVDCGSAMVKMIPARISSATPTAFFSSSHSPSFPSQHLHSLMNSAAVAPVSARAWQ